MALPSGIPNYSYADELRTPTELGIGRDGSFDGIMRAVGGVNYYVDAIGFGESTMLAKSMGMKQSPLGLRYFIATGATCSNGEPMYEYVDTIPSGMPGRVGGEIKKMLGVDMRGMAPGIMEDAVTALNPKRIFDAATGGYARCKKVTLPVGDADGNIKSRYTGEQWIKEPIDAYMNGTPQQSRWVLDSYISADQYDAELAVAKEEERRKIENANAIRAAFAELAKQNAAKEMEKQAAAKKKEGFIGGKETVTAGLLFAGLFVGVVAWTHLRK